MAKKLERRSFIERLLGKKTSQELDEAVAKMTAALDKKGVDRKEFDEAKAKGILEDTITGINDALVGLSDNIPEDLAPKILALVMGSLADLDMPVEEEAPIETMQDDEEEEIPEQLLELAKQVNELATESTQVNKDMQELIPYFVTMAKSVDTLTPLIEKSKQVDTLEQRIKALEGKINLRPRTASKAKETETENETIKAELEKGVNGSKTVLGVPVKGTS